VRRILVCLWLGLCLAAVRPVALPPAFAQEGLLQAPATANTPTPAPPAAQSVEAKVDPAEDEAIGRRLRTTYDTVDGLAPVQVRVTSGVVVLTGEVSAQALRQQAARLAANVRGVAEVENRIEVAQDLEGRLTPALRRLGEVWSGFVRLLPVILLGAAIMAGAFLLGRGLARLKGLYRRISVNAFIAGLLAQVVQTAVLLAGLALTMLLLDATGLVNTLLGAAGIVGLALGFALRDTVENYIASILLSLRRPFDPFDYVRIEGHEGMVIRLTSRATVLLNQDGNQIRIPNAVVFKGLIVNFTRRPQRRFTFTLGIAPDEDLGRAQRVALEALGRVEGVLSDPPPSALYESVGESAVTMIVAGWMDQTTHDFLRVRSEAIRVVLTRMGAAHVDLPEPTLRLRRAPKPAASVGETHPPIATGRDGTLDRAVEQERIRGQDGLAQAGREE
jgi:small-conductance mechanosensitive channel